MRIPSVREDNTIPDGATCQEASPLSFHNYIACGAPAVAIVFHDRDGRGYYMCAPCADHNIRNRGGRLVAQRAPITTQAGRTTHKTHQECADLISVYGDRHLIETVRKCWLGRAKALRENADVESAVIADRYARGAALLESALAATRS